MLNRRDLKVEVLAEDGFALLVTHVSSGISAIGKDDRGSSRRAYAVAVNELENSLMSDSKPGPPAHEFWLREWTDKLSGDVALDVGANAGWWSAYLLERYRSVIAFEPDPDPRAELHKLKEQFGDRLAIMPVAIGAEKGKVELNRYEQSVWTSVDPDRNDAGDKRDTLTVDMFPLDHFSTYASALSGEKRTIELLKIDVEGMDYQVLLGAKQILALHRPWIILEVHNKANGESCRSLLEGAYGYSLERADHPWFTPEQVESTPHWWYLATPPQRCPNG